ncbi:MAG: GTP 3',8-cyclase MoaA [Thermoleophilia bacterium]|jgi:cyclic pyranopterin phosphate synthase
MGQAVDYLRLSVTDRCNLRCVYCMPLEGVAFKSHWEILSYEEMLFFVEAAAEMGISKIRVTGGEPLVRKGLPDFIGRLRRAPGINDVALTTNGLLLPRFARDLKAQGLSRINISLDSLDPDRYERLTRGGSLDAALNGIEAAFENDLQPVKLNVVMMPELLEELADFVALTKDRPLHVRFIEWMPVGGCGPRSTSETLTKSEIMDALDTLGDGGLGHLVPVPPPGGWGPARYYRFPGYAGTIGFIGSVSDHFCGECNRLRLTADGRLKNCLFSSDELDARPAIRSRDKDGVIAIIRKSIECKTFDKNVLPGRTSRGMSQVGG